MAGPAAALWPSRRAGAELDVLGLGESSLDRLVVVEEWPQPGEKLTAGELRAEPGGQVASAVLGCARLGLRAGYIGALGRDDAAETILKPLREQGVDLSGVRVVEGAASRSALIGVRRRDGERTIIACRDPRLRLDPARLDAREIERTQLLHVDASDPDASEWAARCARAAGIAVVLDADRIWPGAERLLRVIDFPVVAQGFAEELGETGKPEDGLVKLAGWGARLAVATCGKEGALARAGDRCLRSSAVEVTVRDTTGAGDAFHAGFIWGVLQGWPAEQVLRAANAAAALSCTAFGAQQGLPGREALEGLLRAPEPEAQADG